MKNYKLVYDLVRNYKDGIRAKKIERECNLTYRQVSVAVDILHNEGLVKLKGNNDNIRVTATNPERKLEDCF